MNPETLFHGSTHTDIEEFEPRNKTVRSPEEGPVVFATPDKAAAIKNLFEGDDSWTHLARVNGIHVALISDRERFTENDHGGACYELPGHNFVCNDQYGGGKDEWTSTESVHPLSKEVFTSALDAMIQHNVQVYFVESSMLEEFRNASNKALFLSNLKSENEERGALKPNFVV